MMNDLRQRLMGALERVGHSTSDYDLNAGFGRAGERPLKQAGVLVAVALHGPEPMLVMTKRASHLSQHPGQIAFPGGKVEPVDAGPIGAALREAEEEIGLAPDRVEVLGTLSPHETVTGYSMVPVLGLIGAPFDARPEEGEVAEVFELPLSFVTDAANYRIEARFWRGTERRYYTVPWGPYYVWGATALVLRRLTDRLAP